VRLQRVTFSLLLPILELTLWFVLVPSQAAFVYFRLRRMAPNSADLRLRVGEFAVLIPRTRLLPYAVESVAMRESRTITAVNAPGLLGEIVISLPISWPNSWHPTGLPLFAWRSLVLPFFCLPAWWFVGRGLDALCGWHCPRWWTLLAGTLLSAGFLTLLLGLRFGLSRGDRVDDVWIFLGLALWTLEFALFPALWLRRSLTARTASISGP
jgi:hypothetical protein